MMEYYTKPCCSSFENIVKEFGWFKIEEPKMYVMPYIKGTYYRINNCPSCGKYIRDIHILENDFKNLLK